MKSFPLSSILMAATFTLAPLVALTAPVGAQAQAVGDYRCTDLPVQVRAALAASTDTNATARARRLVASGQQLCDLRSEGPAARQFRSALRVLGVSEVRAADARQIARTDGTTSGN